MNFFKSVADLLRPPAPTSTQTGFVLPFGLTEGGLARLRSLKAQEEWPEFIKALDELVKLHGEALLGSTDDASIHFERGFILGVRKVATLIDEIEFAQRHHDSAKRTRENVRTTSQSERTRALFGSPAWRSQSK